MPCQLLSEVPQQAGFRVEIVLQSSEAETETIPGEVVEVKDSPEARDSGFN